MKQMHSCPDQDLSSFHKLFNIGEVIWFQFPGHDVSGYTVGKDMSRGYLTGLQLLSLLF